MLASQRRSRELTAPIGNHLVHVHVELRAAAGHPYVQREHVVVLTRQDLVADLENQFEGSVVQPAPGMVSGCRRALEGRVRRDHFSRDQVPAYAEMLERTLGLSAPQPIGGNTDLPETVRLCAELCHVLLQWA